MPRFAPSAARLLPVAAAALIAACGGGDGKVTGPGNSPNAGSFSGTVAGGIARSITGVAYYGQAAVNQPNQTGFALAMGSLKGDSTFKDVVVIGRANRALPGPGTYTFHNVEDDLEPGADAFVLVTAVERVNGESLVCFGTTGTLTVQAASGGRLKGSYTSQGRCVDASDPEAEVAVSLSGTFDAVHRADLGDPTPNLAASARARAARSRAAAR